MIRIYIPVELRRLVIGRAGEQCEYCLIHQDDTPFSHHIDHITPLKPGGQTSSENLALACHSCNRYKGSDLTTIDPETGEITSLFNPRLQVWAEHFELKGEQVVGQTSIG